MTLFPRRTSHDPVLEDKAPIPPRSRRMLRLSSAALLFLLLAVAGTLGAVSFRADRRADARALAATAAEDRRLADAALRKAEQQQAEARRIAANRAHSEAEARRGREAVAAEQLRQQQEEAAAASEAAAADQLRQQQEEAAAASEAAAAQASQDTCLAQMAQAAQDRVDSAARVSAQEAASVDPRNGVAQAIVAWRAARRNLALTEVGTQPHYEAIVRVNQAQQKVSQLELEDRIVLLRAGLDPRDTLGILEANLRAATLRLEAAQAPLPAAEPLYDFELVAAGESQDCS